MTNTTHITGPNPKRNMTRANAMRAILEHGKPVPAKGAAILIPADLIERIDAIKDPQMLRSAFVRDLVDKALRVHEGSAGPEA